jgi:hypothetical protein
MIELTEKTQAQKDIDTINAALRPVIANVASSIEHLNNSRSVFWSFHDDQLNAILAEIGAVKLQAVFANHAESAALLNDLAERCGIDARASIGTMRDVVFANGVFTVVPIPEPEPEQ